MSLIKNLNLRRLNAPALFLHLHRTYVRATASYMAGVWANHRHLKEAPVVHKLTEDKTSSKIATQGRSNSRYLRVIPTVHANMSYKPNLGEDCLPTSIYDLVVDSPKTNPAQSPCTLCTYAARFRENQRRLRKTLFEQSFVAYTSDVKSSCDVFEKKTKEVVASSTVTKNPNCPPCPPCKAAVIPKAKKKPKRTGPNPIVRMFSLVIRLGMLYGAGVLTNEMGVWRAPMHPTKTTLETVMEDTETLFENLRTLPSQFSKK